VGRGYKWNCGYKVCVAVFWGPKRVSRCGRAVYAVGIGKGSSKIVLKI